MRYVLRITVNIILLTCVYQVSAQGKYAFVYAQDNCAGRFALSNVFLLSGNALNLSKEEICDKYKKHHFITNNCDRSGTFDNCNVEIYNSQDQATRAYELLVAQSRTQYGSGAYYTLFFSISASEGPEKQVSNKNYIVPYAKFINSSCGGKMVIGPPISYECSPLTVKNNFDAFYNKHYAKGIGYFIDSKTVDVGFYQTFNNYDAAVKWRQSQASIAASDGMIVYYIDDFNEPCSDRKFAEPPPTIKPIDIAGTWKFVMSWPSAPNLLPLHGHLYFDIAGDGVIKGRMISDPGERMTIRYTFTGGQIRYYSLSFNVQTAVPDIIQVFDLSFNCLFKLTGTARNVYNKFVVGRKAADDIPATIELTR